MSKQLLLFDGGKKELETNPSGGEPGDRSPIGVSIEASRAGGGSESIARYLGSYRPRLPLEIVFTQNRSTILSVRQRQGKRVLRIQEVFRTAPREVWEAVVGLYLRGVPKSQRRALHQSINRFLLEKRSDAGEDDRPPLDLDRLPGPRGEVYDLDEIYQEVCATLSEAAEVVLTWSERINRRTMGSWHETRTGSPNLVRINRLLDDERVPRLYVASVLHHELLHEILGYEIVGDKRVHHSPEFRRRERAFSGYHRAEAWATANLAKIYRSRRRREKRN